MYEFRPIEILPGVQPTTENTAQSTPHYLNSSKIRFVHGYPEKIGGWDIYSPEQGSISGAPRMYFSYSLNDRPRSVIGTNTRLFYLDGQQLTNITPLVTATTAIANSLDTYYIALGSDPLATTDGSADIVVTDTATQVRVGDSITLSGVSGAVNGIPDTEINAIHQVRAQDTNSFTITVSTEATSTGSGGGGSVILATGIMTVNQTAHGFSDGDRIKLQGAADTGGITAAQINIEHIIRNVQTNSYDIFTAGTATSSVSGGGGASTTVQGQIAAGLADASVGQGYGLGRYGVGRYGVSKTSTSGADLPRLWAADNYGNNIVLTPGNQTGVYSWDTDTQEAPVLVSNAPTAVNYVFVSDEILVTLGASATPNRIKWSDQGDITTWTATAQNQAGEDDKEGASRFLSHLNVSGINLIFTETQVYTMKYIGRPFVWRIELLDSNSGIISQNARVEFNGVGYWMGSDNFYFWRGGNVEIIPSNSINESTLKDFVFNDLNLAQKSKVFAWFNEKFNEIWWHYPSEDSDDPDMIVRFNVKDFTWTPDTMERTAGEYPVGRFDFHRTIDLDGNIYRHENGPNDNGEALAFSLTLPYKPYGTFTEDLGGVIPDSLQVGDISLDVNAKRYPQSTNIDTADTKTISPTTERVPLQMNGRYIQYVISGNEVDQTWRAGDWMQEVQRGPKN